MPLELAPIGYIRCERKYRYETPRQGVLDESATGTIELLPGHNYEQALTQLEGFERIWVIYQFHLNDNWKPMVQPPRHTRRKVGVFATRSPHRPNPLGMSCVRLERVEGLTVHISGLDMLDGTPVFDIKPYIPYCDAFPGAATGWASTGDLPEYHVVASPEGAQQMEWLLERAGINLRNYASVQLQFDPRNSERKRITSHGDERYTLAYRTWRIHYRVDDARREVCVTSISSGYLPEELADTAHDKYGDKALHREYGERASITK